jgi:hypothetical protein
LFRSRGTTKLYHLKENLGAIDVELTSDDLREIESAASKITVHAARYPKQLEKMTGLCVEVMKRRSRAPYFRKNATGGARSREQPLDRWPKVLANLYVTRVYHFR